MAFPTCLGHPTGPKKTTENPTGSRQKFGSSNLQGGVPVDGRNHRKMVIQPGKMWLLMIA